MPPRPTPKRRTARRVRPRSNADDLRSAARLAIEATTAVTSVVEEMHRTLASGPAILGAPLSVPARALTGLAYTSVRGVTRLVGGSLDLALAQLAPLLGHSALGPQREAFLAALNGTLGDHLSATHSSLAIEMQLRRGEQALTLDPLGLQRAFPKASGKLVVLIHGSSLGSLQWTRHGHNHGVALERDLGFSAVAVNYNSGLHISTNGHSLDALLERLVRAWPLPVRELVLLGHSMGGLVARSACHAGSGRRWRKKVTQLITLGTPHHGASLERAGNRFEQLIGLSRYSAPLARLAKLRSAGVTDLRFGSVLDSDWAGSDRFASSFDARTPLPLPDDIDCYAMAATSAQRPRKKLPGDGLVSVESALGQHVRSEHALKFPKAHQWIGYGMHHLDLLSRIEAYDRLRDWIGAAQRGRGTARPRRRSARRSQG